MTVPVTIIGSGGFGRETLEVVRAMERSGSDLRVSAVVDDNAEAPGLEVFRREGVPYLGDLETIFQMTDAFSFLLAIGEPGLRRSIARRLEKAGHVAATAIHPSAGLGPRSVVGAGSIICAGAQISGDVTIGEFVHVNPNATVGHDAILEDFVSVNPGAIVSGFARLHEGVLVGAGAVVLQGIQVHADAIVGAAACVTRDVADSVVVKGVPAK